MDLYQKIKKIRSIFDSLPEEKKHEYLHIEPFEINLSNRSKKIIKIMGVKNVLQLLNLDLFSLRGADYITAKSFENIVDSLLLALEDKKPWKMLTEHEKLIATENWYYSDSYLTKYFLNDDITLESISNEFLITRERVRQLINKNLKKEVNYLLFFCLNNKISTKQFNYVSKFIPEEKKVEYISRMKNNIILNKMEKDIKEKKQKKIKEKEIFRKCFVKEDAHLDIFEINLADFDEYNKLLEINNIDRKNNKNSLRPIIARLEREVDVVHVNKRRFLYVENSKIPKTIDFAENTLMERSLKNHLLFLRISIDDPLLNDLGFQEVNDLHSFMKKYSKSKNIFFKHQPRVDFIDVESVPKLLVKQLDELWEITFPCEKNEIIILLIKKNIGYSKIELQNMIHLLNTNEYKYIEYENKIWRNNKYE